MTSSSTRELRHALFLVGRNLLHSHILEISKGAAHRVDVRCGYVEGRNLVIEFRYERGPELAAEQVRLPVEGAALLR
jgi:hypothetical protein